MDPMPCTRTSTTILVRCSRIRSSIRSSIVIGGAHRVLTTVTSTWKRLPRIGGTRFGGR